MTDPSGKQCSEEGQDRRCGCDESIALRAALEAVTAERDYLLTGITDAEARVMRQELAKELA